MNVFFEWRWWVIGKKYNTILKSVLILKKNLIANLSTIIFFLKTKIKPYSDEATDFHNKKISKVGSNHTCLAVINADSAL